MRMLLNEKQWRQYLAMEAQQRGSVAEVVKEARVSRNTVKRGQAKGEKTEVNVYDFLSLADGKAVLSELGSQKSIPDKWNTPPSLVHL